METPLRTYLACYGYGQGGVWLLLDAPSHAQAQAAFPGLAVFEERPKWMSESEERVYRQGCEANGFRWHINRPSGWLQQNLPVLANERSAG